MTTEYTETLDESNQVCPYCGHKNHVECEDYSETPRTEECSECSKKYHGYEEFVVDHYAVPDCALNGEKHEWEPFTFRDGSSREICSVCNKMKGEG